MIYFNQNKIYLTAELYYTVCRVGKRIILAPCEKLKQAQRFFKTAINWVYPLEMNTFKQFNPFKESEEYKKILESSELQEKGICRAVTYPRVKTVITGIRKDGSKYSDGLSANVKYYKTDFISKHLKISSGDINNENELLLQLADSKRKAIKNEYSKLGVNINPLVIIQFPDKSTELIQNIENILNDMGYSYENKSLAKWMSDKSDKINLDGLKNKNGEQKFLLMKQAIATGWNCPRAKILVKLRENMKEDFEIQTIGRIRRMPEAKHYNNELLDNAYLYTFDEDFKECVKEALFSAYNVKRIKLKEKCKTFTITKENKNQDASLLGEREIYKRIYDFMVKKHNLVSPSKNKILFEAVGYDLSDKINYAIKTGKVVLTSQMSKIEDNIKLTKNVKTHDDGLAMRQAIDLLKSEIKTDYSTTKYILNKLFYGKNNAGRLLKLGTSEYYAFVINNREKLKHDFREAMYSISYNTVLPLTKKTSKFIIPEDELLLYNDSEENIKELLSNAYYDYTTDCFVARSKPERLFERYCEKANSVEWVYKNGDKGAEYFSIVYYDGLQNQCLFYPDYIVKLKDNSIWIIETKGGESDSGTSENIDKYTEKKFIALKEYAEHYNINFGFVRNRDIEDQSKLFLNNSEYTEDMSNNWKPIENFIK